MIAQPYDTQEVIEVFGPLAVLSQEIEMMTRLKPTAVILPLSQFPLLEEVNGLPVIRGDRVALVYEP